MPFFLSFLKNPKILMGIGAVIIILAGGFYIMSMAKENGQLEESLNQKTIELTNMQLTIQNERERFSQTIANYDEVMSKYVEDVSESTEKNRHLQNTINRLSRENEELQQCMEMEVPQELLDEIFTVDR